VAAGLNIDWSAPWLAPWRDLGEPIAAQVAQGIALQVAQPSSDLAEQSAAQQGTADRCARALNAYGALLGLKVPKVFVPQSDLPAGMAYEQFIFESGQVPTRDGLHDFFNGLCWLRFPETKLRLNALQADQIARTGIQPVRGPARDALTVFDENAAFLQAPDALWDALLAKDWQTVFVTQRALWADAQLILFGHALLEKLVAPRKAITAHVYRGRISSRELADVDAWMAADLSAEKLATKPFAHLPVLGVPGWWPANEAPEFYADASVFRLLRPRTSA
jgi:hypothetical protein